MPLIQHKTINPHITIGIWQITESMDQLNQMADSKEDQPKISNAAKQLQRLSVRCIANRLLEEGSMAIQYDNFGKPYLTNSSKHISVSHTSKYSALIVNEKYPVGIDIELIHPRIEKITSKFMSVDELNSLTNINRLEQLYVYWCAKEALYKYYGKKELIFCKNLRIDPFIYTDIGGTITGHIITDSFVKTLLLHYEKINDHLLVYVVE